MIFHNLANYNSHLFVKNLGKSEGNIKCIPNNEEKYISFSKDVVAANIRNEEEKEVKVKNELRFIDSFKFMAFSLDKLVSNLSFEKLNRTEKVFKDKIELVSRKGVYPYDYKEENRKHVINLLLIADKEKKHYCLMSNMSRFLSS